MTTNKTGAHTAVSQSMRDVLRVITRGEACWLSSGRNAGRLLDAARTLSSMGLCRVIDHSLSDRHIWVAIPPNVEWDLTNGCIRGAQARAAAPRLLEAAKAALHEMRHTNAPRNSFTDAVDMLDAAIAAATGGTP